MKLWMVEISARMIVAAETEEEAEDWAQTDGPRSISENHPQIWVGEPTQYELDEWGDCYPYGKTDLSVAHFVQQSSNAAAAAAAEAAERAERAAHPKLAL